MQIKGRRILIAGSASPTTEENRIVYGHSLVRELTRALADEGANFICSFGKEPKLADREDGPSIIFDWTISEVLADHLKVHPDRRNCDSGKLIHTLETAKTDTQIPSLRREIYDALRASEAMHREFTQQGWSSGYMRREWQAEHGDILIGLSGGEGFEHLARVYASKGKPVIPLDLQLGSSQNDGCGGASAMFHRARYAPNDYFRVIEGESGGDLLQDTSTRDGTRPVIEVVNAIMKLISRVQSPKVFYIRLLDEKNGEFKRVETFFRQIVDPFVQSLGFEPSQMGIGKNEHAWMNQAIFDKLHHSSVVIADVTELRPNCLLELGYALGNCQRVIVSAKEGTPFPFDIYGLHAHFWKTKQPMNSRIEALREHWKQNIDRPRLVTPRGPR